MPHIKSLAVLVISVLTALAVLVAIAVGTASVPASASAPASTCSTIRFTDIELNNRSLDMDTTVTSSMELFRGRVVGYSAARWVTNDDGTHSIAGSFALEGGMINYYVPGARAEGTSRGRVSGGAGGYENVRGAISWRPINEVTTRVRITYCFG